MAEKPKMIYPGDEAYPEPEKPLPTENRLDLTYLANRLRSIKVFNTGPNGEEILNPKKTNKERILFIAEFRIKQKLNKAREEKIFMPFKGKIELNEEGLVDIL